MMHRQIIVHLKNGETRKFEKRYNGDGKLTVKNEGSMVYIQRDSSPGSFVSTLVLVAGFPSSDIREITF